VLILPLLVASCGTRLTTDERAYYAGTGGDDGGEATIGATASGTSGTGSGTPTNGGGTSGTSGATGAGAGGGTTGPGAGAATGDGATGAGAAGTEACAAPSTEVGVTESTITLGGVFQLSGLLPGFAQTAAYGAQAYTEYLNENGGLCGRQVEYLVLDDGFDASRNADQTGSLLDQALSSVGGFSAADDGGADVLAASNAIDVSTGTTPAKQVVPNHYPLLGSEYPSDGPGHALPEYRYAVEQGATRIAVVYVAAAAGRGVALRVRNDASAAGMQVVLELEVSPTQFSYASTARAVADSGAQMVVSLLEINGSVQLAEELSRLDVDIPYSFYRLGYDQRFLDSAGAAAEGAVNFTEFLPFEEAGSNEALDRFLQYYDQVAPGTAPTFQAMQGWVAMDLYVQVLRSLQGPITRDAVSAAAQNLHTIETGGLYQPFDFGSRQRNDCKVVVRAVNGRYQREAPASGVYC
jgi:ABC-type branched-subunit amino acid transport system substrate-binding protein